MSERSSGLSRWKRPLLFVMGPLYVLAGVTHFVAPDAYERVVPPGFPRPRELVYASGVAEIALGLGVLHPETREASAWGLVALLVAVFPANVYMAVGDEAVEELPGGVEPSDAALWARLPLQAVLVAWAWWYTKPMDDAVEDDAVAGEETSA
ncbi:DoxX family protein [Halorubellus salinus]|uniref:DoxX family protein n=1 Tax=Halorubellus salinus TaxID=755309 RepID=UPI001D06D1BC|nr:hypothetical protein [Halorubellus salinus]